MTKRKIQSLGSLILVATLLGLAAGCGARNHSETHSTSQYHHHLTHYDVHTHSRHY